MVRGPRWLSGSWLAALCEAVEEPCVLMEAKQRGVLLRYRRQLFSLLSGKRWEQCALLYPTLWDHSPQLGSVWSAEKLRFWWGSGFLQHICQGRNDPCLPDTYQDPGGIGLCPHPSGVFRCSQKSQEARWKTEKVNVVADPKKLESWLSTPPSLRSARSGISQLLTTFYF